MTKAEARNVPIEMYGQLFTISPDGDVTADRVRLTQELEAVRLRAADIYLIEKIHELSKPEREYWRNVKRTSPR